MADDKMDTEERMDEPSNEKIIKKENYDWKETIEPHIKIAVVGKKGCGKSSLILAAVKEGIFPHPEDKFVSKQHFLELEVDGKKEKCMVAEVDDGMTDNNDRRDKIYSEMDVILLCFNENHERDHVEKLVKLDDSEEPDKTPASEVPEQNLIPNLLGKDPLPDKPVVVVKVLRNSEKGSRYTRMERFSGYLECSPHERMNVKEVFQEAVKKAQKRGICEKK